MTPETLTLYPTTRFTPFIAIEKDVMWLGTFGGGLNLAIKTADGYQFKHFLQDNYGEKRIRVIEEDRTDACG